MYRPCCMQSGASAGSMACNPLGLRSAEDSKTGSPSPLSPLTTGGALQGIDVDARSGVGGETALAAAAGAGQAQAVRWLLRHGADPALQDDRHASALDKARAGGHAACAQARACARLAAAAVRACARCRQLHRDVL
jgi:hypothetical protein